MSDTQPAMFKLAVFGDPVAHSLSPVIHEQFGRRTGLAVDYQAIHTRAEELPGALTAFREADGQGANLTVPHKQAGISVCESLHARAQAAGAVNTVIRTETGWHGDNTDGIGLIWDLKRLQVTLKGSNILIIGSGGAARGIVPVLLDQQPAGIVITNRTDSKAEQLAAQFNQQPVSACKLDAVTALKNIHLIIHATAAGHVSDEFNLSLPGISANPYCYDLSYGQAALPFLNWAARHEYPSSDGLGMLVGQAAEAFRLWTGESINDEHRIAVLDSLSGA